MIEYDSHKWLDHFFDIRGSLVREIIGRVSLCVAWSAAVVAFHNYVAPVGMPFQLHTLLGLTIGLLLVFRTSSSYERFWEGRKLWGGIVNETRNLVRSAGAYMKGDPVLVARLTRWTAAFPWAAMHSLRGTEGIGPQSGELPAAEAQEAISAHHPALAIAANMSECLAEARERSLISDIMLTSMDQNIQLLVDYLGSCERIRKTPMPFAYAVHLRRALVAYCFTLPFAMVETFGWTTIIDVLIIAYTFFGIEEIGVEIESPFGHDANDIPIEDICETIHQDVYAQADLGSR
ncbi:bestrophin family protein [Mycobacterium sp.]|uniref:bestrophin family protein n=1 Tax=Mycobacterium sp. TaxID=1785 RepID=UPI003A8B47EE